MSAQQVTAAARERAAAQTLGVRTLERSFGVLTAVVMSEAPITLADAARQTRLPVTTAARLLRGMESLDLVVRDRQGCYTPGRGFLRVAAAAIRSSSLTAVAKQHLEALVDATGESAYLAVSDDAGETASYILQVPSPSPIQVWDHAGRTLPLKGRAVGAALHGTVNDSGYAAVRGGADPDVTAIASPVFGSDESVIAAISVIGPTFRISDTELERYGVMIAEHARELGQALG